uniref:NR LBD domain-containing protein n=1 Tax=Ditylenchus dipsaci TaxID=166011 RepID=A0A915E9F0_9BILA
MFDKNTIQSLAVRINFICNSIVDSLQHSLKQLKLSEVEYVSMKAVIALDPSIRGVSQETSTILSGARDSVQNALFLHLMDHYPSQKAVARYGQILMLSANVSKIGAFLSSVMDFFNNVDSSNLVNLRSSVYCTIIPVIDAALSRSKRQTYHYPDELRKYAHTHPNTKIIHGTVGRYAPQEYPAWYTRTLFKWNGESRLSPYHVNDVLYPAYQKSRLLN